jgi:hypothetical protein
MLSQKSSPQKTCPVIEVSNRSKQRGQEGSSMKVWPIDWEGGSGVRSTLLRYTIKQVSDRRLSNKNPLQRSKHLIYERNSEKQIQ